MEGALATRCQAFPPPPLPWARIWARPLRKPSSGPRNQASIRPIKRHKNARTRRRCSHEPLGMRHRAVVDPWDPPCWVTLYDPADTGRPHAWALLGVQDDQARYDPEMQGFGAWVVGLGGQKNRARAKTEQRGQLAETSLMRRGGVQSCVKGVWVAVS